MNIKEILKHIVYTYEYDEDTGEIMPARHNENGLMCIISVTLLFVLVGLILIDKFI